MEVLLFKVLGGENEAWRNIIIIQTNNKKTKHWLPYHFAFPSLPLHLIHRFPFVVGPINNVQDLSCNYEFSRIEFKNSPVLSDHMPYFLIYYFMCYIIIYYFIF